MNNQFASQRTFKDNLSFKQKEMFMRYPSTSEKPALLNAGFILLADDDEDDRSIMQEFFFRNGYQSHVLPSGKEALSFLRTLPSTALPSVILFDCAMPQLNGEEALMAVKTNESLKRIPVLMYSSEMSEDKRCRLLALGAKQCFSKVYNSSQWNELKDALDSLLAPTLFSYE